MDLELSVQQLASMGLEVLHPDVLLSPRFGQSELSPHAKVRPLLNKPKRALSRMPSRSERCERQTDGVGDQGDVFCSPTGSNTGALPTRQFSRRELHHICFGARVGRSPGTGCRSAIIGKPPYLASFHPSLCPPDWAKRRLSPRHPGVSRSAAVQRGPTRSAAPAAALAASCGARSRCRSRLVPRWVRGRERQRELCLPPQNRLCQVLWFGLRPNHS